MWFERNVTFCRTHSAHSRAIAFCVSLLRRRISNSVPYSAASRFLSFGMKNCRFCGAGLSVAFVVVNDGAVKMKSNSPMDWSSALSASNAKIENVLAAMRSFEPGWIDAFRSSPRMSFTLSMIFTSKPSPRSGRLRGHRVPRNPPR